ncbi:MAG: hypothetical protein MUF34_10830 [Polyangiaceae bacterium]|jgi:hypothetical protein|nr:hypothetical protein [Polyangiaceae bacterium]
MNSKSLIPLGVFLVVCPFALAFAACSSEEPVAKPVSTDAPATGAAGADPAGAAGAAGEGGAAGSQSGAAGSAGDDGQAEPQGKLALLVSSCQGGCELIVSIGCSEQSNVDDCKAGCLNIPQEVADECFEEAIDYTECLKNRESDEFVCDDEGLPVLDDLADSACGRLSSNYFRCLNSL